MEEKYIFLVDRKKFSGAVTNIAKFDAPVFFCECGLCFYNFTKISSSLYQYQIHKNNTQI